MWKPRPDEKTATQPSNPPASQPTALPSSGVMPAAAPAKDLRPAEPAKLADLSRRDVAAHIGKSVVVKGELSGSEDLYLDGEVEGTIGLRQHSLIVGPNARIRANISARELVVHGRVEGNISGAERVELKKSCVLSGDISTQRIVIEDGAFFKGSIDLQRDGKVEARKASAAIAQPSSSYEANTGLQDSFLTQK
jgi:cytoskeletal protein CcmA (bactofilin family)